MVARVRLLASLALAAVALSGPAPASASSDDGCPGLDSQLQQLTAADDPGSFATSAGLIYADGAVAVIVELGDATSQPDPSQYGLDEQATYANLIQGRALVDRLCALASDPAVQRVRPRLPVFLEAP
jgi:hypothetical protein